MEISMSKIMFYINTIHYGGAERVIVNLANEFLNRGYETVFITSYKVNQEYFLNKKILRLSLEEKKSEESFIKRNITRTLRLRKICRDQKPDILVSFMAEPNFRAIMATRFMKINNLISVRNDPNKEYPSFFYRFVARMLYPFASGCVFQTEDAKKWFSKRIQEKSKIILNHVDEKFYKVNYTGTRKNIVTVGRLEAQKNHEMLIRGFALIADEFPSENLLIYGEGSQLKELKTLSSSLGLNNRVFFMGTANNIQEKIKDAKLFVLSSDYEGLPNALMEAMALGIPVVSTDCPCGGPRMLIDDKINGLLVKTSDVHGLSKAMRKILIESSFASILSEKAKIKAQEFESHKVFEKWENYIMHIDKQQD